MKTLFLPTFKQYYFISPHLDDAVLSAYGLLNYLSKHSKVTVINVFTKAGSTRPTLSIKAYLSAIGYPDGMTLYTERIREDAQVIQSLNINRINLGFVEALWRYIPHPSSFQKVIGYFIPELLYVYPTYRFHIQNGQISTLDTPLITDIAEQLAKYIPKNSGILCPYGFGNHIDHTIVRKAVEMIAKPIYWYDQPYFFRLPKHDQLRLTSQYAVNIPVNQKKKIACLSNYQTQISSLFDGSLIPKLNEFITHNPAPLHP